MSDKLTLLYTMKGCPFCVEIKTMLKENNISFLERDIHENEKEYEEFVKLNKNDLIPAFGIFTIKENEVVESKYIVPDRDFQDLNEAMDKVKKLL